MRPRFDWIAIPAGAASIGVGELPEGVASAVGHPSALVEVPAFALTRTLVTNAAYARFVAATGHRAPAHWEGATPPPALVRHPVTYVDWHDAIAFCAWAGVRLPTETEWEKAARGTDGRRFPWGDDAPTPRLVNGSGWYGGTTEVGSFPAGAGPSGALDLAGNAWEWTASGNASGPAGSPIDRVAAAAPGRRVLRGGSFNHAPADLRAAARSLLHPDACDEYIGFRVASDDTQVVREAPADWVLVPAGPFRVGSAERDDAGAGLEAGLAAGAPGLGRPRHNVSVAPAEVARTPVTNAQYAAFRDATGARAPGHWEGTQPPPELRDHPVTYVDWHEAQAFCAWAGVRLPTEVEWEVAAAGLDGRSFPWGEQPPDPSRAWFGHADDDVGTRPVGECPAGATPDGILDLAGTVWEWTSTLHRPYPYRADDGREDPASPGPRVLRGGSFRSPGADLLRAAFRSRSHPARRRDHIGFRVARDRP